MKWVSLGSYEVIGCSKIERTLKASKNNGIYAA
jgi:hypothetical protein